MTGCVGAPSNTARGDLASADAKSTAISFRPFLAEPRTNRLERHTKEPFRSHRISKTFVTTCNVSSSSSSSSSKINGEVGGNVAILENRLRQSKNAMRRATRGFGT